ncbi:uncharacterized protein LOC143061939 [Mytilus galloprovincialis]|uniref:uncharacterized protein LOC143061939 n=1 Tax=Mytilus galloprovincialis TaxID=29158 RepID=UPI003F7CAE2C
MSSGTYIRLRNEIFPEEALKLEQTINQHKLAISGDKTSSNTETTEPSTHIVKGKMDNISAKSETKITISKGTACTDQSEDNIPDAANYNRLMSHNSVPGQTFITSPQEDTDRYNITGNQSAQDIKTGGSDICTVQDQGNHTHASKDNVAAENHNLHTKEGEIISLQRSPGNTRPVSAEQISRNTRPVSAEQISIDEWVGHEWQEHRYKQLQDNDLLLLSKAIHPESLNSVAVHFNLNQLFLPLMSNPLI